jgi:hypothetical protein
MNCDTGHLVRNLEMVDVLERSKYQRLTDEYIPAAGKKLNGADEAMVSLTSGGKLSQFAGETRKERRKNKSLFTRSQKLERRRSI